MDPFREEDRHGMAEVTRKKERSATARQGLIFQQSVKIVLSELHNPEWKNCTT
jgi:hypothetical protein